MPVTYGPIRKVRFGPPGTIYDPIRDAFVPQPKEEPVTSLYNLPDTPPSEWEDSFLAAWLLNAPQVFAEQHERIVSRTEDLRERRVERAAWGGLIEQATEEAMRRSVQRHVGPIASESVGPDFVAADTAADDQAPVHGYERPIVGTVDTTDEATVEVTISAGTLRGMVGAMVDHYGEKAVKDALDIVTAF